MKTDAEPSGKRMPLEYSLDDYWLAKALLVTHGTISPIVCYIGEIAHLNAALENKNAKQVLEKM